MQERRILSVAHFHCKIPMYESNWKLVSYSMQDFIGTLKIIVYLSQKIYNKQLKVQSSNQVLNSVDLVGFLIDSHLATFTFLGHERML